jgi:hypothetical protein
MPHPGLLNLNEALRNCPNRPPSRAVILVARVRPAFEVANIELPPACDRQYKYGGGRVLLGRVPGGLEIVTWNTGETGDLQPETADESHAERQLIELMRQPKTTDDWKTYRKFTSMEIEISHSPCPACADKLKLMLEHGKTDSQEKPKFWMKNEPFSLKWAELYRLTNAPSLHHMQNVGWRMLGRSGQHPEGSHLPMWW